MRDNAPFREILAELMSRAMRIDESGREWGQVGYAYPSIADGYCERIEVPLDQAIV
jgi:hypothetical protein